MKKIRIFSIMMLAALAFILCAGQSEAKLSRLKVKGTKVVNEKGKVVQLKGVSTHGIAWFPDYVNKKQWLSWKKFGANIVRIACYSDKSAGYSTDLYNTIDKGVKAATDAGMYAIIDWHILSDGNPVTNESSAKKFFTRMAKKYAGHTNVLYEICNEPNGNVSWKGDIKPYANRMYKLIRKYDKKAIIIVGTPSWSQDVDVVAKDPLKGVSNVMYSLHFYAATHKDWNRSKMKSALNDKLPIFVSEFSICDASGNGGIDTSSAGKWMKLIKKNKIPFVSWSVCNKNETSALIKSSCKKTGTIKKSDLSKTGKWLIKQLKK